MIGFLRSQKSGFTDKIREESLNFLSIFSYFEKCALPANERTFRNTSTLLAAFRTRSNTIALNSMSRDLAVNKWTLETLEHCKSSRGRDTLFLKRGEPEISFIRQVNIRNAQRSRASSRDHGEHNISDAEDRDLPPSPEEVTRITLTSHNPVLPCEPSGPSYYQLSPLARPTTAREVAKRSETRRQVSS